MHTMGDTHLGFSSLWLAGIKQVARVGIGGFVHEHIDFRYGVSAPRLRYGRVRIRRGRLQVLKPNYCCSLYARCTVLHEVVKLAKQARAVETHVHVQVVMPLASP